MIYRKIGPVHVNQELIGIDGDGKVKVWVNENWALNHLSHEMPRLKSSAHEMAPDYRDESEMVHNIINVV